MTNARMHLGDTTHVDAPAPSKPHLSTDAHARLSDSAVAFKREPAVPVLDGPLHVVTCDEGWAVRFESSDAAAAIVHTKKEAMQIARKLAKERGLRVVEHSADGRIL